MCDRQFTLILFFCLFWTNVQCKRTTRAEPEDHSLRNAGLGYSAAGGERATRSKKLGRNKSARVFACLNAWCRLGTGTYYPRRRCAESVVGQACQTEGPPKAIWVTFVLSLGPHTTTN